MACKSLNFECYASLIWNLHFINEGVNYDMQRAVVVIPARFDSARFPGKPLAVLKGKPLIQRVYEQILSASLVNDILVATDDKRIFEAVVGFGGKAVMTSREHVCGTDRITEAAKDIDCDIIVNVQGDEPLIRPQMVDEVIMLMEDEKASIGTLAARIKRADEVMDPNVVKVVFNEKGYALYFSRFPIPYQAGLFFRVEGMLDADYFELDTGSIYYGRSFIEQYTLFKHIGIYAYRKSVLLDFSKLQQTRLEKIEKLEQLRALENGITIKVKETEFETIGVDTPDDLKKAEEWLNLYS